MMGSVAAQDPIKPPPQKEESPAFWALVGLCVVLLGVSVFFLGREHGLLEARGERYAALEKLEQDHRNLQEEHQRLSLEYEVHKKSQVEIFSGILQRCKEACGR